MITARVGDAVNQKYANFARRSRITIRKHAWIEPTDRIFTIGSCFAEEIRKAMAVFGFSMLPRYASLQIDPERVRVDELPKREHLNYYNSFTVLQEFERIAGEWTQEPDDYWTVSGTLWPSSEYFQDPYRRLLFGRDVPALHGAIEGLNQIMSEGFRAADVFLITYGMVEVFVNKRSGRVVSQKPLYFGGGGLEQTTFKQSTFEENLQNLRRTVEIVERHRPGAKIVMTVSPVALERTFSGDDIVVANCEGKSLLRAVLGQIAREFENVVYFPAYELVTSGGRDSFEIDGRHVKPEVVQQVVNAFIEAYVGVERSG